MFAAEVEKQKNCVAIVKDAQSLELGSIYAVKKNKRLIKFKVVKKTKTKAKISIYKKYCKQDIKGLTVVSSKGKKLAEQNITSSESLPNFGLKTELGYFIGITSYDLETTVQLNGIDTSFLGVYYLNLDETRIPLAIGINSLSPAGSYSDEYGEIEISGSITSLRLLAGFNVGGLVPNMYFSSNAGIDIGLSNTMSGQFTNQNATNELQFPSSYNDAQDNPLGDSLISTGDSGLGGFFNLEVSYIFDTSIELAGSSAIRAMQQTLNPNKPQRYYVRSSGSELPYEMKADLIWGATFALGFSYNF